MPTDRKMASVHIRKDDVELHERLIALAKSERLSVGRLMLVCALACIDTLEKEVPKKRIFTLNGKKVSP